jgi:hypothetical protein
MDQREPVQAVYKPFYEISLQIQHFISNDIQRLDRILLSENRKNDNSQLIQYSDLSEFGSFIMYLIEEFHKEQPSNWLKHELESSVKIKDLPVTSIGELRERLDFLFPKRREDRPVIFFDECPKHADSEIIYFISNLLRMIGLIGVFMGTNAEACESSTRFGSSHADPESKLFGYVVHKLPPMNEQRMTFMKKI